MIRLTVSIVVSAAAVMTSGCMTPAACEERSDYVNVRQIAPIAVPDSLDPLPEDERLQIPVSSTPPDVGRRCLEKPPRYFDEDTAAGN
ncbi:MAG: hypothetical protein AAFO81_02425 [Pseudomonadota bacterium]